MDTFLNIVCYTAYFILAVVTAVTGICPQNALEQVQQCTAHLGIGPPQTEKPNAFIHTGDVERSRKACRDGEFRKAVDCLERISSLCQGNSEREHILRMMVNVSSTRHSVDYFCNNLHVFEANAECIARQHEVQERCARNIKKSFVLKMKSTSNMDVVMMSTCRFFRAAFSCTEKVLKCKCGDAAADIVMKMISGFQPPRCVELESDPNYSVADIDVSAIGCGAERTIQTFLIINILWVCSLYFRT